MFAIIGILVVFGAVVGGYLMEKGNLLVLLQPAELIIIGGAAVGTVLIANPPHILGKIGKGVVGAFKGSRYTREWHLNSLKLLYDLFDQARRSGLAQLESDVDDPSKSKIFPNYPAIMKDHHVLAFICDTFRTMMIGGVEPFDLDQTMETDMDVHHHGATQPVGALSTMADSLPGLGIVAAVLGVVITMGALGGPPEQIGHKVAAALVGTFLGILLCYGLAGPLAANMAKEADAEHAYYLVLRVAMTAFNKGIPPLMAVDMGRRAVPSHIRPNFQEMETACRKKPAAPAAPAPGKDAAA
jgi:chemotaxis protein MotA